MSDNPVTTVDLPVVIIVYKTLQDLLDRRRERDVRVKIVMHGETGKPRNASGELNKFAFLVQPIETLKLSTLST